MLRRKSELWDVNSQQQESQNYETVTIVFFFSEKKLSTVFKEQQSYKLKVYDM